MAIQIEVKEPVVEEKVIVPPAAEEKVIIPPVDKPVVEEKVIPPVEEKKVPEEKKIVPPAEEKKVPEEKKIEPPKEEVKKPEVVEEVDADVKAFADWKKKNPKSNPMDFFEAQSLDPEKVTMIDAVRMKVKAEHSHLNEAGIEKYMKLHYGIGADMAALEASDDPDDNKMYYDLLKKQNDALAEAKQKISEKKVALSTPKSTDASELEAAKKTEKDNLDKVVKFQSELAETFKDVKEFEFSGVKHTIDEAKFAEALGNILVSESIKTDDGKQSGVMLMGVEAKDVARALYFLKNEAAIVSEIALSKENAADEQFNNVKSPKDIKTPKSKTPDVTVRTF